MIFFDRRHFLQLAACSLALPAMLRGVWAQSYPSRPLRIIVSFPTATTPDIVARLVAQSVSERVGQPIIVDNRTGAAGNLGTEVVVHARPDGYTLLRARRKRDQQHVVPKS